MEDNRNSRKVRKEKGENHGEVISTVGRNRQKKNYYHNDFGSINNNMNKRTV